MKKECPAKPRSFRKVVLTKGSKGFRTVLYRISKPNIRVILIALLSIGVLITAVGASRGMAAPPVVATAETAPTRSGSADDPAIWIHPTDPSLSLIIGTDKGTGGGLGVYALTGEEVQFLANGRMNNVDVRYNFPLGGQAVDLVTATERNSDSIAVYRVDPTTRQLENVAAATLFTGITVYGTCMYHSPVSGRYYVYVNSKAGEVEQWELFDNGSAQVEAALVRSFDVGSQTEGCVADDEFAEFYIGEENVAIWKYGAEPGDGTARTQVDTTGSGGHLTADVEGLTLYYGSDGTGYLIASSQGSDEYVVYERAGNNAHVMTFEIVAGNGIDAVSGTDGIDVTNVPLGPAFPQGVFVAHDTGNSGGENYKLVPWQTIANFASPPLTIDTTWDPRQIEGPSAGIWISAEELASLPASGPAWEQLKAAADAPLQYKPDLSARNKEGLQVLAKALVYARTGDESYRQEVINAVMAVMGTEGGDDLATFRALGTYVIAADLVVLPPNEDQIFRDWLADVRHRILVRRSVVSAHEERPNNWGTHAGASRAAIAVYLGDAADLDRTAQVFKGYLGDRAAYAGFKYGKDLSWQCDPSQPVGINPKGCTKDGHSTDGVLPDDQRRCGGFSWPPCTPNSAWGGLQGAIAQAVILHRAGYDTFNWGDQALLRAYQWLYNEADYPAEGDDTWQLPLVDYFYGTDFWDGEKTRSGKNMGWTGWTHSSSSELFEEVQTGGSTASTIVTTSASLTAVAGHLYLAAISSKPNRSVLDVSGLGLLWTKVQSQCAGRGTTGVSVWMAQGTPSGDGVVTATLSSASVNAVIAVTRYSGVSAIGNVQSANTNGVAGACSGGVDNGAYSFNLTTTVDNAVVYAAAAMRNRTHTPGAGYTEQVEVRQGTGGGRAGIAVEDQTVTSPSAVTVNGSFSKTVDWAVVAVQIRP